MKHLLLTTIAAVVLVGCGPPARNIWQAAADGKIDVVKYHLAAGVDVNVKTRDILGTTPLHEAVRKNRKEIVELLIAEGANVNSRDGSGETALYQAAHRGHLELCKLLINNGADLNISTSKITMGHSPLYFAIRNRHADVAELLITSGADVNIKNGFGESPMDMAIHAKLQNIVNLLIEHGAETSALKDTEKTTEESKKPLTSIWKGATSGNIQVVTQHLNAGVDVNAQNTDGETPLLEATYGGHKNIVELLISKGADVNMKDDLGFTPVQWAAREGHKEIVELLISKGANLNARDRLIGATTLHYAAVNGHKEIVKILIKNAADFNSKDMAGQTPLNFAIDEGMDEIADLLRKHGGKTGKELKADSGKTGDEIKTPTISIWRDAEKGDIEAVKLHLDNGVDVNAKDNIGWTPLHFATVLDHKEIVELLIATGADVNAKNKEGRTPLNWASGETADLLRKHGGKTGEELEAEEK